MAVFAQNQKLQVRILWAGCLLLVFVIRPWQLYFLNDDFIHIPAGDVFVRGGFLRPMPNLLVAVDTFLYGKNALGFFVTSLLLHFSCVFAVFYLAKAIVKNYFPALQQSLFAFITAALFLCYPFHAEPLMWVISRVSIMTSITSYISLQYYMNASRSWKSFAWSWFLFVAGLFTYESMWNLVFVFGCIGFANVRIRGLAFKKEINVFILMLLTFILYLGFRAMALNTIAGDGYDEINDNLSRYVFMLINLVKLTGRHFTPPFINTGISILFFGISLLLYAWAVLKLFKKGNHYGWLAIVLWLCMISGVVTASVLGIDTHYNESERYIYYSSVYFCLFLGLLIALLSSPRLQIFLLSALCVLFLLLLVLVQRNYHKASVVAKQTLQLAGENPDYRRAFFVDVPERYKGAVLFRTGPKDAIRWIKPACRYDTMIVLSMVKNLPIKTSYERGQKPWQELALQKKWNQQLPVVSDSTGRIDTLRNDDVLFWFKPEGIYIIQHQ